ncbi:SDR family oxidoreductase [Helicobacter sp.]|uniref:SDR family oxidoreductase n=1 Tax=Helicobacter sp. TaxID=218 RepID=UPI002588F0C3|nr:SDR family oxidoreductase [Helicobacter sp.]
MAERKRKYPLKKIGQPSEVAELIYFLASPKASFITGGLYLIDGGLTAGIPH